MARFLYSPSALTLLALTFIHLVIPTLTITVHPYPLHLFHALHSSLVPRAEGDRPICTYWRQEVRDLTSRTRTVRRVTLELPWKNGWREPRDNTDGFLRGLSAFARGRGRRMQVLQFDWTSEKELCRLHLFTDELDWLAEGLRCVGGPEATQPAECVRLSTLFLRLRDKADEVRPRSRRSRILT